MIVDSFELTAIWPREFRAGERDVAELRLFAGGELFTRISDFDRKEERDFVRGSAVSLAFWLADHFWRLRYESLPDAYAPSSSWRLRHEMTSASGGTLWPPVMIHSTGERVVLAPVFARPVDLGRVRFVLPPLVTISGSSFETGLMAFLHHVAEACASAIDGEAIRELVGTLAGEREDSRIRAWRRIEARLGYDPDSVPQEVMSALEKLEPSVGEAGLDEAVAAAPGRQAALHLERVLDAARQSEVVGDLSIARRVANDLGSPLTTPPWQLGREAARRVRAATGFGDGPLRATAFSELLQTTREDLRRRGTARGLPYSARLQHRGERHRVALQSADLRDRRFELSCALADEIWAHASFGVMSKAKTDRQKFQRAFAQNLLVPFDGLAGRIDAADPSTPQIEAAAVHYHVHPNVIRRLLVLEGVVPKETLEEKLEAA